MDIYMATGICTGFITCEDEEMTLEAWQLLIDTGTCWQLRDCFSSQAASLIEAGVCQPAPEKKS